MSRLPRPHVPMIVRCRVAARQIGWNDPDTLLSLHRPHSGAPKGTAGHGRLLQKLLVELAKKLKCEVTDLRLDHDPALENRVKVFRKGIHVDYKPAANDPEWLAYRPHGPEFAGSHLIKTNVRGDHGQHSDRAQAAKNKNIAKNRDPKRRKAKIAQPKNFRWPSRPFNRRKK